MGAKAWTQRRTLPREPESVSRARCVVLGFRRWGTLPQPPGVDRKWGGLIQLRPRDTCRMRTPNLPAKGADLMRQFASMNKMTGEPRVVLTGEDERTIPIAK